MFLLLRIVCENSSLNSDSHRYMRMRLLMTGMLRRPLMSDLAFGRFCKHYEMRFLRLFEKLLGKVGYLQCTTASR